MHHVARAQTATSTCTSQTDKAALHEVMNEQNYIGVNVLLPVLPMNLMLQASNAPENGIYSSKVQTA